MRRRFRKGLCSSCPRNGTRHLERNGVARLCPAVIRLTSTKELLHNCGVTSTRKQKGQKQVASGMGATAVGQLGAQHPNVHSEKAGLLPSTHLTKGGILAESEMVAIS